MFIFKLEGSALPNIIKNISEVGLNHVVIGLDKANKRIFECEKIFKELDISHTILWNDGPGMKSLDKNSVNYHYPPW